MKKRNIELKKWSNPGEGNIKIRLGKAISRAPENQMEENPF